MVVCAAFACDRQLNAGYNLRDAAGGDDASVRPLGRFTANGMMTGALLNGDARLVNGAIVLTEAVKRQGGTALFPTPFRLESAGTMSAHLVFRIEPSDDPADGVALFWHADPRGARALGGIGGSLAVGGITPGITVAFDTHDGTSFEQAPRVVIARLDSFPENVVVMKPPPFALTTGEDVHAWVELRAGEIAVFVANNAGRPGEPWVRAQLDLRAELGESVFVGVGAATGDKCSRHVVESLDVSTTR
jgi:hypothetical protein